MCDRIILCVSGPDAKSFLQNLVTNDVTKLDSNIIYSALLTPQGKLVSDFFLIDSDQGILIDVNSRGYERSSSRFSEHCCQWIKNRSPVPSLSGGVARISRDGHQYREKWFAFSSSGSEVRHSFIYEWRTESDGPL